MYQRTDVAQSAAAHVNYTYDGSFEGLMCCVFEGFSKKELPAAIHSIHAQQSLLFESRFIKTDTDKAARVIRGVENNISSQALELVQFGFLTCRENKELLIDRFLRLGFKHGAKVIDFLTDDTVSDLRKAVRHLTNEAHLFKGFVRFSVFESLLAAQIEPKNEVLPLLAPHFCDRYQNEAFLIHDKTHQMVLLHRRGEFSIVPVEGFTLPPIDAEEAQYRRLWKQFYNTIAIEGRTNPRCRMSHMPKRYWGHMTEFGLDTPETPGRTQHDVQRNAPAVLPPAKDSLKGGRL